MCHRDIDTTSFVWILFGTYAHVQENPQIIETLQNGNGMISKRSETKYANKQERISQKFSVKIE